MLKVIFLDYYRAQAAFCLIAIALMIFTNSMAVYSLAHHRYMYKRLTAGLYVFVAMCIVTVIEILHNSVDKWNVEVAQKHTIDSNWDYSAVQNNGRAVYLAYCTVAVNLSAAIAFAYSSHKQKGSYAATAEFEIEDRPVHIGRGA